MTITSPSLCSYISNCARDKPHIGSCSKAHVRPRCIARPVLQEKTFRLFENRCLRCVELIFVNLPQFAKSGLKGSLNRFFWYFSLHLFRYFGLVSSLFVSVSACFTAILSMAAPSKRTVGRPRRRASPKYIRLRESVFQSLERWERSPWLQILQAACLPSSFYIECWCSIVNKGPFEISWKQNKWVNMNNAVFNLTYEASDILNVNVSSGVSL